MPAVTLDLWHTLMYLPPEDEEAYMTHQLAIGQEVLRASPPLAGVPDLSDAELGRAFERAYVRAVAESAEGRSVTPRQQIARAARETGRDTDPQEYLSRLKAEVERTPFRIAPGALELLAELSGRHYRLGVISNTIGEPGEFLRPILTKMGFDRYVETYVFSDEQPWTKPSAQIFRFALDQLNEAPHEAVHVGDGWADLEGARRAGFRGAVLFTGLHSYGDRYRKLFLADFPGEPAAKYRTDRLEEVGPIVEKLLPLR
ncbi:MAG: HAD family hydrolase [Thermoplasmata archaeon]|jgi:HAD superfamily hydrolase (TIGR01549 family)